jgi:hypothetical protein
MKLSSFKIGLVAVTSLFCSSAVACEDLDVAHPHEGDITVEMIRERVLERCGLSSKLAQNKLPWYFHYEFGVELMKEGATDLAIEPLQMTANLKSEPSRGTRMYGMWFVNYLPYYQISLAYSQLGEWDKAWDALQMSESMVEFSPGDFEYDKFESLKALIEVNRQAAG